MGNTINKPAPPIEWFEENSEIETLAQVDTVFIQQQINLLEVVTLDIYEAANKYKVMAPDGKMIFMAIEESNCWQRFFCCTNRAFRMKLYNQANQVVMTANRRFRLCPCCTCFPCCLQELKVFSGVNEDFESTENLLGSIKQPLFGGCFRPKLEYFDANDKNLYHIEGPFCQNDYCCDAPFEIKIERQEGLETLGEVRKLRPKGFTDTMREAFTDADNFQLAMPKDFDATRRAVQVGSAFLIDFMFFEDDADYCACPPFLMYCCGNACGLSCCSNGGCCTTYICGCPITLGGEGSGK